MEYGRTQMCILACNLAATLQACALASPTHAPGGGA
jgi:hypothetical protein